MYVFVIFILIVVVVLCVKLHKAVVNPAGHFLTAQPVNINALK